MGGIERETHIVESPEDTDGSVVSGVHSYLLPKSWYEWQVVGARGSLISSAIEPVVLLLVIKGQLQDYS